MENTISTPCEIKFRAILFSIFRPIDEHRPILRQSETPLSPPFVRLDTKTKMTMKSNLAPSTLRSNPGAFYSLRAGFRGCDKPEPVFLLYPLSHLGARLIFIHSTSGPRREPRTVRNNVPAPLPLAIFPVLRAAAGKECRTCRSWVARSVGQPATEVQGVRNSPPIPTSPPPPVCPLPRLAPSRSAAHAYSSPLSWHPHFIFTSYYARLYSARRQ